MMTRTVENIALFFLIGVSIAAGNSVGYKIDFVSSATGVLILAVLASVGFLIGSLPYLKKLPMLFWVSVVAIFVSTPYFWWHRELLAMTDKVQFLSTCTPVLALAGLAVGKDLEMFKKISWRIVPVALAVFAGTFLFAAVLAHFTLKWEGAI